MSDLHTLGAEIRDRRESLGLSVRQCARRIKRSHVSQSLLERGHMTPGDEMLARLVAVLAVDDATHDRWHALAGHVAPDLAALLLAHPERWGDVRRVLGGSDG